LITLLKRDAMERLSLEDNETGEESKDITNGTKQDHEERLTVNALYLLLGSCLKPGVHQNGAIERILEILQTGQLDPLLISPPPSQHIDWISDLVRLPDRTLGLLSRPEQGKLPDLLQHRHYCEILQRAICTALASYNFEESQPTPTTHIPILFSCLISTHPSHQLSHHLWNFLAAFSLTSSANAALTSAVTSALDSTATEKVLLSGIKSRLKAGQLTRVLGSHLTTGTRWPMLQHLLFVRCQPSSTSDMRTLVGVVAFQGIHKVLELVNRVVGMLGDPVEVEGGQLSRQLHLWRLLCLLISHLNPSQREGEKRRVMMGLGRGVATWLESGREKRNLGMAGLTAVLQALGEKGPEWELEDGSLKEELHGLSSEVVEEVEVAVEGGWQGILVGWVIGKTDEEPSNRNSDGVKIERLDKMDFAKELNNISTKEEDLDSDDDDLPAFDMSNDTPVTEETKVPILYIRDVIHHLSETESLQGKRCLQLVPSLAASHLKHEDPALATELLRLLLHVENRTEEDVEFPGLKRKAVEAVVVSKPLPSLSHLVPALFSKDNTLNTKFLIIDCLVGAGVELAEANDAVLGRFIALSVAGLCAGGGGAWGGLKVEGLEKALLAQLVRGTGSLVRLGVRSPGWEAVATDFLELLVALAGRGHGEVEGAVVGGLAAVVALLRPSALREGSRLGELLLEAVAWAGGLEGDLGEAGKQVAVALTCRKQEAIKMEMEESLQPREIKMIVPSKSVKL